MIKQLKRNLLHQDAWLSLFQDDVLFPGGVAGSYAVVERKNGVGIVVIAQGSRVLLQKEYRYATGMFSWEIPGGGIDSGESPEEAAVRELREEAGLVVAVDALRSLGSFYPLSSFSTEKNTIFLAQVQTLEYINATTEQGEIIAERRLFSFEEVWQMIDAGVITDLFTITAIELAKRKLGSNLR